MKQSKATTFVNLTIYTVCSKLSERNALQPTASLSGVA